MLLNQIGQRTMRSRVSLAARFGCLLKVAFALILVETHRNLL